MPATAGRCVAGAPGLGLARCLDGPADPARPFHVAGCLTIALQPARASAAFTPPPASLHPGGCEGKAHAGLRKFSCRRRRTAGAHLPELQGTAVVLLDSRTRSAILVLTCRAAKGHPAVGNWLCPLRASRGGGQILPPTGGPNLV